VNWLRACLQAIHLVWVMFHLPVNAPRQFMLDLLHIQPHACSGHALYKGESSVFIDMSKVVLRWMYPSSQLWLPCLQGRTYPLGAATNGRQHAPGYRHPAIPESFYFGACLRRFADNMQSHASRCTSSPDNQSDRMLCVISTPMDHECRNCTIRRFYEYAGISCRSI
jgi:hypothetical protein